MPALTCLSTFESEDPRRPWSGESEHDDDVRGRKTSSSTYSGITQKSSNARGASEDSAGGSPDSTYMSNASARTSKTTGPQDIHGERHSRAREAERL